MVSGRSTSDAPRVLIVDDDRPLVELLEYNLQAAGCQTLGAYDGETALARLREQPVDLVILDLMLPGMDGYQVCRRIRQQLSETVPILMLTAKREVTDQVRGLDLGADDYLIKPFEMAVLLAQVRALLRRNWRRGKTNCVWANWSSRRPNAGCGVGSGRSSWRDWSTSC